LRPTSAYIPEVFAIIERQSKGEITGVETGFYDLDQHTSGFQRSDLIVLGGRPRMGKTALATDIAYNIGIDQRRPVAFFELEMAGRQIVERKLFALAKVNGQLVRRAKLPQRDFPRLSLAVGPLSEAKVFIDQTTSLTPLQMLAKCRRMKMKAGLDLVVVDNIQKMRGDGNYKGNFRLEIADITKNLKNIAKDLDVPILAISHLSRGPDHRADPEPVLSDLQESGNIEQDADIVMLLYREEVYKEVEDGKKGETKVIFAKYRNGQEGYVNLRFNEEFSSFANWGGNREEPPPSFKDKQTSDFLGGAYGHE
jgi:replicative DNA helicase